MDIHGNFNRNVWNTSSGHSCKKLTRTTFKQPWILPSKKTPGLWSHVWRPISLTLEVDYFGIGYVGWEHADHLMSTLKMYNEKMTTDW